MSSGRWPAVAAVALLAAATAGCGLGAGESSKGEATLTVTRDYGLDRLAASSERDPSGSETVLRFLDREAEITTRYDGGFVQSINGIAGSAAGARREDWFFYVNGVESPVGAADAPVKGGDRVWWDYRDWTAAMRVPAVVGSWPEPFARASDDGQPPPIAVECSEQRAPCAVVADRLAGAGVDAAITRFDPSATGASDAPRILVGPWAQVSQDPAAAQLDQGPATSGVFARFQPTGAGRYALLELDVRGNAAVRLGRGAGLVAALREQDDPPTWVVTGTDPAGVRMASRLLDAGDLRNRYALAVAANAPAAADALPAAGSAPAEAP